MPNNPHIRLQTIKTGNPWLKTNLCKSKAVKNYKVHIIEIKPQSRFRFGKTAKNAETTSLGFQVTKQVIVVKAYKNIE